MNLLDWFSKNRHLKEMKRDAGSRDPGSSKTRFLIIPHLQKSYQAVPRVVGIGTEGRRNLVPKRHVLSGVLI